MSAPAHHNDEGVHVYQQNRWENAKQHFDAAIAASPEFAEAHYNSGMVLYRLNAMQEGDALFLKENGESGARQQSDLELASARGGVGSGERSDHARF